MQDCIAVGCGVGIFDWAHPAPALYGGTVLTDCVFQNCAIPIDLGEFGLITMDGVSAVNDPAAMSGQESKIAVNTYGFGDLVLINVRMRGFKYAFTVGDVGRATFTGENTFLDNATNIRYVPLHDLVVELDERNFGEANGRNIVFQVPSFLDPTQIHAKAIWRRPGEPTLELFSIDADVPGPTFDVPGLVNGVAKSG